MQNTERAPVGRAFRLIFTGFVLLACGICVYVAALSPLIPVEIRNFLEQNPWTYNVIPFVSAFLAIYGAGSVCSGILLGFTRNPSPDAVWRYRIGTYAMLALFLSLYMADYISRMTRDGAPPEPLYGVLLSVGVPLFALFIHAQCCKYRAMDKNDIKDTDDPDGT